MFNSIRKYYNTLKYLKPVQIYGRIFSYIKKNSGLIKLPAIPNVLKPSLTPKTNFIHHDPWNKKEDLVKGNFTFLNLTKNLGFPANWKVSDADLLWQFNLHYFNYLPLLNVEEQIQICRNWVEQNNIGQSIPWHPYVISLRLISWCKIGFNDEKINKSIYKQAAYLYRNLEYYHPANHYLENARALIFAGLYFKDQGEAGKWLKKGLEIYFRETPKQVLKDGGYFERSTMYHAIMLEGYLDILNVLQVQHNNYNFFKDTASRMLDFLIAATHPDGRISLFNDSTQEIAPSTKELIYYAERLRIYNSPRQRSIQLNNVISKEPACPVGRSSTEKSPDLNENEISPGVYPVWGSRNDNNILDSINSAPSQKSKFKKNIEVSSFKNTGFYIYRDDKFYLIIDGGSIGPDNIPAHAHADIFSYELSVKGVQFIVDSGVYEYNAGEMRSYVRSTKAHNTVSIDGKDQAECWESFRVARRYKPYDVSFKEADDKVLFEGKFDGYAKLIGDNLIHHRKIEIEKGTSAITVNDNITGSGNHNIESFIHLHPGVIISKVHDNIVLSREGVEIKFLIFNLSADRQDFEFIIEDAWYCPEFGKKIPNKVIKIYSNQLPINITYKICVNL